MPSLVNSQFYVASEEGNEVYVFDASGRHLQTLLPLTGAILYTFGYDSAGQLNLVTDGYGNTTKIVRDANERPTAIASPYGQTSSLVVDENGYLKQVTDPAGNTIQLVHDATGLLRSLTDARGNPHTFDYDPLGRLISDVDPAGGSTTLSRTDVASGYQITETRVSATTPLTRTYSTTFEVNAGVSTTQQFTNTWSNGLQATHIEMQQLGQLSNGFALPDGSSRTTTMGPDPVWGIQVPIPTNQTLTQGALAASRSTTLGTAGNPFTINSQTDTESINGRTYTHNFNGATMSYVDTSPAGRTLTVGLDSLERVTSTQVSGLLATQIAYDGHGRLQSRTQGTRTVTFSYDSAGYLASVTDPLSNITSFVHDADGRVTTITRPDGSVITFAHDANGNLTSVTPPGKSAHVFTYTPVNLPASYTPPAVAGGGATAFAYNLDRDLTTVTRPDGSEINYGYDSAGRLSSVATPTGTTTLAYDSTTGNLVSEARSGEAIALSYEGPLPIEATWTGTVYGSVGRAWNNDFLVASETVDDTNAVAFAYNNDGLVVGAGPLTIERTVANGLITGTTLGVTADVRTYNTYGELVSYTASANGSTLWSVAYTRDADGRIVARSETIGGTANTYSYTYDVSGRLTMVTKNGVSDTYAYDSNSNRIASMIAGTTSSNGAYDAQDRLLTYGATSYTYTANGELATSQTVSSPQTSYTYDALGNLVAAVLPTGAKLEYLVDPDNHRVGKTVNGLLQTGFLYDGGVVVAQLNSADQVVSRFVHATSRTTPDYMVMGGTTYRIFSDERGSPVLVVDAATGAVAEQIAYDGVRQYNNGHQSRVPTVRLCWRTIRRRYDACAVWSAGL
jgi:YD repeat-containing protein